MKWILSLFGFVLASGCGTGVDIESLESPSNQSIVVTSDYPAVSMVVMPGGSGLCTGTFIGPSTVITATHCTQDEGTYTVVSSFGRFRTSSRYVLGRGVVGDAEDLAVLVFDSKVADPRKGEIIPLGQRPALAEKIRLVGFGCNDLKTRRGTGVKRTGTNQIYQIDDHLQLVTPVSSISSEARALLGPENRSASCFGDSGGPLLRWDNGAWELAGLSHAGGVEGDQVRSLYVDVNRSENRTFLENLDRELSLGLFDACQTSANPGVGCDAEFAFAHLERFFLKVWSWIRTFF